MQYVLYFLLIVSALTLPWWVTVPLMILALTNVDGAPFVVGTALLMDALYGTNIDSLYDISFLYTLIFGMAAVVSILMRRSMLD